MPTIEDLSIDELAEKRREAETRLAAAEQEADALRVAHAGALLAEAFPQHTLAVFARNWDEDEPHLLQLLTSVDGVEAIEVADERESMTTAQKRALKDAEWAIVLIGSDDHIVRHLEVSEEDHVDWVEFDLALPRHETTGA
jgi:hypothetical protein